MADGTEYFQLSPRASADATEGIANCKTQHAGQAAAVKEKALLCLQMKQAGDRARLFTFGSLSAMVPAGDLHSHKATPEASSTTSESASKPDATPRSVASPNRRRRQGWKESLRDHERPSRGRRGADLTIPEGPRLRTASRSMSRASSRCCSESSRGSSRCGSATPSACSSMSRALSRNSRRSSVKLTVPEGPVLATEARSQSRRRPQVSRWTVGEPETSSACAPLQPLQQLQQQLEVLTHRLQQADFAGNGSLEQQVQQVLQQQQQLLQQHGMSCHQQKHSSNPLSPHTLLPKTDSPLKSVPKIPQSFQEQQLGTQPQDLLQTPLEDQEQDANNRAKEQDSELVAKHITDEAGPQDQHKLQVEEHQEERQEQRHQQHAQEQSGKLRALHTPDCDGSQVHNCEDLDLRDYLKPEAGASPSTRAARARQQALKSLEQAQANEREGLFCFRS